MRRVTILWASDGNLEIISNSKPVSVIEQTKDSPVSSRFLMELPDPIIPDEEVSLQVKFSVSAPSYLKGENIRLPVFYPQLWWDFATHNDFKVKIELPEEYTLSSSGLLDKKTGYYYGQNIRSFGLFIGKDFKSIETNAKDVLVQVVYKAEAEECARLVLETAVQAINFYRERFGLYPYRSLAIVPGGMTHPAGGYPIATSMVGIHAMEQFNSMPKLHWQWITAHEIGHQYWGEYVMEKDKPGWLWIGMGIYADREYVRAKGLKLNKYRGLMSRYIKGVRAGLDTTINITPEEHAKVKFDFNNVVTHGKGYSVISALDCVLGKEIFSRIYQRCLKEFAGRRLGASEFRTVCEKESGQDLGWFFDQWVNSNRYLSYEISSKSCEEKGNRFISKVEVKCLGDLKMPVPITVYYEDGSSEVKFTNRLLETDVLEFISDSPLKEVKLDAENELALVVPPPSGACWDGA
ncbi:MAG: M1 family aminopeptidase [Planctomycetota bacterium]